MALNHLKDVSSGKEKSRSQINDFSFPPKEAIDIGGK